MSADDRAHPDPPAFHRGDRVQIVHTGRVGVVRDVQFTRWCTADSHVTGYLVSYDVDGPWWWEARELALAEVVEP